MTCNHGICSPLFQNISTDMAKGYLSVAFLSHKYMYPPPSFFLIIYKYFKSPPPEIDGTLYH